MNAPDRIWAWLFMPEKQNEDMQGGWTDKPDRREAEYVRADLFAALEAEKAKAEAERDAAMTLARECQADRRDAEALLAEAVEALEIAEEALFDLGACDDPKCKEPCCAGALPRVRATLARIQEARHD